MFIIIALVLIFLCAAAMAYNNKNVGEALLPIIVIGFIILFMSMVW